MVRITATVLLRLLKNNDEQLIAIMGLFEPAMVVLMGGLVLTIVLAILLPIFDLNTMVR